MQPKLDISTNQSPLICMLKNIGQLSRQEVCDLFSLKIRGLLRRNKQTPITRLISSNTLEHIISDLASPGIILLDDQCFCKYSNSAWHQLIGISNRQAVCDNWLSAIHENDAQMVYEACVAAIQTKESFQTECRLSNGGDDNDQTTWVGFEVFPIIEKGSGFVGCMGTFTDITHQRLTRDSLIQLLHYDPLTNLPNRSLLMQHLKHSLEAYNTAGLALVFIDLDGFKLVNDTLGRTLGNKIILEVSQRINNCLKSNDFLARLGSDEFTAIVSDITEPEQAALVAKEILQMIKKPITVEGETVYISASVGIAVSKPGITADRLIQHADVAMYNAKKRNGNNVQFHSHELTAQNRAKLIFSGHIHTALELGEFSVHYQPQLNVASNRICGSEALLRWKNPQLGTVPPSAFIPILEEKGLINKVGEWVLSQACQIQAQWLRDYSTMNTTVSVNVSSLQLRDRHFLNKLKNVLQSSDLPPDRLVLEITETVLLDEYVSECNLLHEISALGVKIAIDDFGTGYGSFSYLKKHPIDHIKIDGSFINNLFECEENKAITTSIIELSHKLGKTVIAEGVDKQEELDFLMMRGCDIYQGFLTSSAIPSADFDSQFLQTEKFTEIAIH